MKQAQAFAPGKLFVAGEYAVVEPGRQALLVAVDRGVQAQACITSNTRDPSGDAAVGRVFSALYPPEGHAWSLTAQGVRSAHMQAQNDVAFAAIELIDTLLRERKLPRQAYTLRIHSDLHSADGRKYGLGSSAAVAVASLKALNQLFDLRLGSDALLKLGILAGMAFNPNGSGGDIAACALGGWVHYASPDRNWIRTQRPLMPLDELLARHWPGLQAQRLPSPQSVRLLAGWTGTPASTTRMVASLMPAQHAPIAAGLLDASDAAVRHLAQAIASDDAPQMQAALRQARQAVLAIAAARGRAIETPALQTLCAIAQAAGAAAKASGAGGGDCGIALATADTDIPAIHAAWRAHHIEPLNLKVSP